MRSLMGRMRSDTMKPVKLTINGIITMNSFNMKSRILLHRDCLLTVKILRIKTLFVVRVTPDTALIIMEPVSSRVRFMMQ